MADDKEPLKKPITREQIIQLPLPSELKKQANQLREDMARAAVDAAIAEIQKYSDADLLGAVARHVIVKIKLF